jgi:hypothetical protein
MHLGEEDQLNYFFWGAGGGCRSGPASAAKPDPNQKLEKYFAVDFNFMRYG